MRNMKYFLAIALLFFMVVGYKIYEQYQNMYEMQQKLLFNEGRSLSNYIKAFRDTYQKSFMKYSIPLNEKTIHLLPVMTIKELSRLFSENVHGEVTIRTVSDRPRNPENMANEYEKKIMDFFRKNPGQRSYIAKKDHALYYFRPLIISKTCMKCHGKRENAPATIRSRYTQAYGYKPGEIRGLSSIMIRRRGMTEALFGEFKKTVLTTTFLYLLLLSAIFVLIRKMNTMERNYTRKLEADIKKKTQQIEKQKRVFETLFEKSSDGIFILDDKKIVQCNEKIVEMLRCESKAELLGERPASLSPRFQPDGRNSAEKGEEMLELALTNGHNQFEWVHTRKNGEEFLADVTMTSIVLDGRNVLHVVWRDISDRKKAEEKLLEQKNALHYQANHDALTTLPNRSLLLDRLSQAIERAKRNGKIVAIFFIDVDNFKKINDSLGHHVGDRVLINIAGRLKSVIRAEDTLARFGGDEFMIVAECSEKAQFAFRLAQEILKQFTEPVAIEGHTLHITASIGISIYPRDAMEANDLIKYADAAMYKAKNEGKNTYCYYSPEMTELLLARVAMEEELRRAVCNEEFNVYYQPQVDAESGIIIGMEALIRWNHPGKGIVSPDAFIPLAEETGLIIEIDRWVMKTAMRQVCSWRAEGRNPGLLSLNLSIKQLMSNDFVEVLKNIMTDTDFRAEWLELEVTEREMMQNPKKVIEQITVISQMGVSVAIDDFGTGYSSLIYLKQFPVNKLKIDRSFIRGLPDDKDDASITKAVIALAKNLNLNVIAEGAETTAQADFLIANGCRSIQGYLFGRPVPAKEMEKMLIRD